MGGTGVKLAFRQSDVRRAVQAIAAAGQPVKGVRFDKEGGFVVIIGTTDETENSKFKTNPWDEVLDSGKA